MNVFSRCLALLVSLACSLSLIAPAASARDSKAEQIFGAIVDQLERHAQEKLEENRHHPAQGVWGNRWNTVPSGPTGSFKIINNSHQRVRIGFARPNGGGTSISSVRAHGTYTKSGLPIGTAINIDGPGPAQQFQLSGSSLSLTVEPDGRVLAASSALPPTIMPIVPGGTGAVYVTNHSPHDVGIEGTGPPQLAGAWADTVHPGGQWVRTDLQVGTRIKVLAHVDRTFGIEPGSLHLTVRPDGSIRSRRNNYVPNPPIVPGGSRQTVVITNSSSANINARMVPPYAATGSVRVITPGGQIVEQNLRMGTRVVLSGSIPTETITLTGGGVLQLVIMPDGRVRIGGNGPAPPPSGGPGNVKVVNRSGGPITVAFGSSVRQVAHPSAHEFIDLAPGKVIRITGSGATATFTHAGGNIMVRALPGGRFENLPPAAVVVPDTPSGPTSVGHVLVANLAPDTATLTYQMPGAAAQTATLDRGDSIAWTAVDPGTHLTLVVRGKQQQVTVAGGQWTSLVVGANGDIAQKTTTERHEPTLAGLVVEPDSEDSSSAPLFPNDPLANPDPPAGDPQQVKPPTNSVPTPNAAPLTQSIVGRFERKTMSECTELVDMLAAASTARLQSIKGKLTTAGIEPGTAQAIVEAAKRGDTAGLAAELGKLSDEQLNDLAGDVGVLNATATLREHLVPLKTKLASGAATAAQLPHVTAIATQAANIGNEGLAAAMRRVRRDLVIRDTLERGLEATGIESRQVALPQGEVNVIYHPWITKGNIYFAPSGLLLVGAEGNEVIVAKMLAADVFELPINKQGTSVPDYEGNASEAQVLVVNPKGTQSTLRFKVNDKTYSLESGNEQALPVGPQYVIEFSRGSSGETTAKFNITKPAMYVFMATDDGWGLVKRKLSVRITNPPHSAPLAYQVDDQTESLQPGGTAVHQSNSPVVITFDAGEGAATSTKRFSNSGDYYFAINPETGYWDLFAGTPPEPFKTTSDSEVLRFGRPVLDALKQAAGTSLFDFTSVPGGSGDLLEELR